MRLLGGSFVEIHFWSMIWDITKIVIIPIVAGLIFHYLIHGKFAWLDKAMPLLSMAGIAFILVIITAAGRDNLIKGWCIIGRGHIHSQYCRLFSWLLVSTFIQIS